MFCFSIVMYFPGVQIIYIIITVLVFNKNTHIHTCSGWLNCNSQICKSEDSSKKKLSLFFLASLFLQALLQFNRISIFLSLSNPTRSYRLGSQPKPSIKTTSEVAKDRDFGRLGGSHDHLSWQFVKSPLLGCPWKLVSWFITYLRDL